MNLDSIYYPGIPRLLTIPEYATLAKLAERTVKNAIYEKRQKGVVKAGRMVRINIDIALAPQQTEAA